MQPGKKKTTSTQKAASTASAHSVRPEIMEFHHYMADTPASKRPLVGEPTYERDASTLILWLPRNPSQPWSRICSSRRRRMRAAMMAARMRRLRDEHMRDQGWLGFRGNQSIKVEASRS